MINTMTKNSLEKKEVIWLVNPSLSPPWRKIRQELKQEQRQAPREGTQLTALPSWLTQPLSYPTVDPLPRVGIARSELGPPTFIIDNENIPWIRL